MSALGQTVQVSPVKVFKLCTIGNILLEAPKDDHCKINKAGCYRRDRGDGDHVAQDSGHANGRFCLKGRLLGTKASV